MRSGDNTAAASVSYGTAAATASSLLISRAPAAACNGVFAALGVIQTVWEPIVNDASNENDETFTVDIISPAGASGVVTILDDDPAPNVEHRGRVRRRERWRRHADRHALGAERKDRQRRLCSDERLGEWGRLHLGGWYADLRARTDDGHHPTHGAQRCRLRTNETFFVTLSAPVNALIMAGTAQITIVDDEGPPTFSVDDVVVSEAAGTATLTVVRSGATSLAASVAFGTSDDTALAPGDYATASGTLNFAIADVSKTITVTINQDFHEREPRALLP